MEKYVNMADIISAQELGEAETTALIELLFFAYRDFVSDPDAILEAVRLRPRPSPGASISLGETPA